MIARIKAFAKRRWPRLRLRTILLATLLFVAALPGVGAVFLRVYENTLVRQTEAELVAQGAALAASAQALWPGVPHAPSPWPEDVRPEPLRIDLNTTPILPERASPIAASGAASPEAATAARRLGPILARTRQTTLASILLLDGSGRILTGSHAGRSYASIPEVRAALAGRIETVLRRNGNYRQVYRFEWLSRAAAIRVHHARPIVIGGRVVGVLLLSRSARALFRGIYEDRGKIALGVILILATLVMLSGLLSRGIARPIEILSAATREVALGRGTVPEAPPTAAIEIQALYADFGEMARVIDIRSRYLRDFAHAVSHEFKTPLAAIRGAIELLQDHHATMQEEERQFFLANAAADAERLAQLVTRLLELARADMARPDPAASTPLATPIARIADGLRTRDFVIDIDLRDDLPPVALPRSTIEAVLASLIENGRQAGAKRLYIHAREASDHVMLQLADDGPGIPPADRQRIFEPFFTSKRQNGGTGLGLAITHALLEASRAEIALLPSEAGATFELKLPRAAVGSGIAPRDPGAP
ncbi:two-component sensor histidine kinase [Sphingomonas oleivorans]|uniref:histidine kinase n=1 Tax=Sphingomonas oleivorans TaxID=1735121 RepID=A0A2T5FV53_9SPHN|nr:HAMP domain-containing sensor histidine kinase [Sphingomonas oleivorans]PTQ08604.1 two-component sensor histidine kinase [Sphingomonas oleivorans]